MDSKVGLIIQLNGVFVITVLCLLLSRSLKITALKYWTIAWLALAFSLISLRLAFSYDFLGSLLFTYYYFGEYIFGFLLYAGCRSLDGTWQIKPRLELRIAPLVIGASIILPMAATDFNDVYGVHTILLTGFFAASLVALRRSRVRSFGWKVTHVAMVALTIDFGIYSIIYLVNLFVPFDISLLAFSPIVDLVLQTTLGVGMVIVLLEKVLHDTRSAHERLEAANRRLEELVQTDPLTAAFSRHAFYGFVKKHGENNSETSGCVGFFDIDDLKRINDEFGHGVGDMAIRTVVHSIREIVRAEDLIFRWGGDEFFVIMIGMDAEMALLRMTKLEELLMGIFIDEMAQPLDIGVSWGFTDFADISDLENAINKADAAMYSRKLERKRRSQSGEAFIPAFPDPVEGLTM